MSYGDKPMGYSQDMMNAALNLCRHIEAGMPPMNREEYVVELQNLTTKFAQSMGGWCDMLQISPSIAAVYLTAVMVRAQSSVIGGLE